MKAQALAAQATSSGFEYCSKSDTMGIILAALAAVVVTCSFNDELVKMKKLL
jgi:hypothetical protein